MKRRKGQSTLEYVIILTAIIAGIIVAAQMFLKPKLEDSLEHATNQMQQGVERIQFGTQNTGTGQ